jgi:hypothetical protein
MRWIRVGKKKERNFNRKKKLMKNPDKKREEKRQEIDKVLDTFEIV